MTRKYISRYLQNSEWVFQGTIVKRFLKCQKKTCKICKTQKGHGPVYYLSIRGSDRRTHMIYIPKEYLTEVKKGILAYKTLKAKLKQLVKKDLTKWRRKRRKRKS